MINPSEHHAQFRAAIEALIDATGRLSADRSPEAFLHWHRCCDEVKRLHAPVADRALERSRRSQHAP